MTDNSVSRWFIAASLLCAVPVLIPTYLPMVDLPQHVAAIMVLDEVHFGDYAFAEMFEFNWLRPYWFGYSLIWAVSYLTGLVWASKVVVALAVVIFVLSMARLRQEVNAPPVIDWFFLAVPFGFAYEWGFINFIVAAPLGPLFLISYHRFLNGQSSWQVILAWMFVLFFAHLLILAFFCMTAATMALRSGPDLTLLLRRLAPLLMSIPIGIGWLLVNLEPRNIQNFLEWAIDLQRLTRFFPDLFSLEYSAGQALAVIALLSVPFLLGVRPKWSLYTLAPPLLYVMFMMVVPSQLVDNLGTYERFQLFGLMFYVLMLEDAELTEHALLPAMERLLTLLPAIVGVALLARVAVKSYGFEQDTRDFRQMLTAMAPESRAMGLVAHRNSEFSRVPVYMHFPVWYQVEGRGLVDFNFAQWSSLNAFYKEEYRPRIGSRLPWYPQEYDWALSQGENYRYFMISGPQEFAAFVLRDRTTELALRYQGRTWMLFERLDQPAGSEDPEESLELSGEAS
jgi:hypothetical protein